MSTPAEKTIVPEGFAPDTPHGGDEAVPEHLRAATSRLQFPPSYVVVGFYRLLSDSKLRVPAWQKCKHGFARGVAVGLVWVSASWPCARSLRGGRGARKSSRSHCRV